MLVIRLLPNFALFENTPKYMFDTFNYFVDFARVESLLLSGYRVTGGRGINCRRGDVAYEAKNISRTWWLKSKNNFLFLYYFSYTDFMVITRNSKLEMNSHIFTFINLVNSIKQGEKSALEVMIRS